MDKKTIIIVDDEQAIRETLSMGLEREGYAVRAAATGEQCLQILEETPADLVILDLMLPGMDGLTACRRIRKRFSLPIIMLTGKADETDRVVGLELGADDYLCKPFSLRELVARVRAVLRRAEVPGPEAGARQGLSFPGLEIDIAGHRVSVLGREVRLNRKEFGLLCHLAAEPDRVFRREELIESIWGYKGEGHDTRTLDEHVKRLRQKLGKGLDVPWNIATVWGVGYKFEVVKEVSETST